MLLTKFQFSNVRLHLAVFDIYVEYDMDQAHIFDRDEPGSKSVTNAASHAFFIELDEIMEKRAGVPDVAYLKDWYLYGTDGIVCKFDWRKGTFHHVPLHVSKLYPPYKALMMERAARSHFPGGGS